MPKIERRISCNIRYLSQGDSHYIRCIPSVSTLYSYRVQHSIGRGVRLHHVERLLRLGLRQEPELLRQNLDDPEFAAPNVGVRGSRVLDVGRGADEGYWKLGPNSIGKVLASVLV